MPCFYAGMNGLTHAATAMLAQEKRLDSITANLANANTPGFKRRMSASHGAFMGRLNAAQIGLEMMQRNDFTQGPLLESGNPLDLGIQGEGFFAIESPDGEVYTRNGEFQMTGEGVVVTTEGYPVIWDGVQANIQPTGEAIVVDREGMVTQGNRQLGKLRLVGFEDMDKLDNNKDGYWVAPAELPRERATGKFVQGAIEGSNVNSVSELVAMISVQRKFEQASQIITQIDRSYQRLNGSN
ncbi:MAG: flagellar hook basal-body protein [Planctomycetes bacterium]|nr:flagellar hook basal-body protein [Planctomycetota bacterium]